MVLQKKKNLSFDLRMRKDRETEIYGFVDPNPEIDALAMGSKWFFSLGSSFTLMIVFSIVLGEMVFGDLTFLRDEFSGKESFFIIRF